MTQPDQFADLDTIESTCWNGLQQGASQPEHPWNRGVLGTVGEGSEVRMVVLREADPNRRFLNCHTDRRSAKIAQIECNPRIGWLFWEPVHRVQLSIRGIATLHWEDEIAREAWNKTSPEQLRHYLAPHAPGTRFSTPNRNLPAGLGKNLPRDEIQEGWSKFVVIRCKVQTIDWLLIQPEGNLRARFSYEHTQPDFSWVAP